MKQHNPDKLTRKQYDPNNKGFRLLNQNEVSPNFRHTFSKIQAWCYGTWDKTGWAGGSVNITYRTLLFPGQLKKLRVGKEKTKNKI